MNKKRFVSIKKFDWLKFCTVFSTLFVVNITCLTTIFILFMGIPLNEFTTSHYLYFLTIGTFFTAFFLTAKQLTRKSYEKEVLYEVIEK